MIVVGVAVQTGPGLEQRLKPREEEGASSAMRFGNGSIPKSESRMPCALLRSQPEIGIEASIA